MSLITATLDRFAAPERRTMAVACGAHALHDGFTDLLYVLLPLWQAQFGLGFVMLVGALILGGLGSAVQHPIGAHLVSQAFSGQRSRTALAGYNFSGDL